MTPELTALTLAALLQVAIRPDVRPRQPGTGPSQDRLARAIARVGWRLARGSLSPKTARLYRAMNNHFEGLILFGIACTVITFQASPPLHRRLRLRLPRRARPLHPRLLLRLGALALPHLVRGLCRDNTHTSRGAHLTSSFQKYGGGSPLVRHWFENNGDGLAPGFDPRPKGPNPWQVTTSSSSAPARGAMSAPSAARSWASRRPAWRGARRSAEPASISAASRPRRCCMPPTSCTRPSTTSPRWA
jgi:hypothetical protein